MSDERDLTPEQEARVAGLLADARVEEPIPAEVAARLDRVLAGMAGEQVAGPEQHVAPVIDIAARRRRRVRTLLVAAAAVVVAGVGIGQVVEPRDGDDSGSADSAAGGAEAPAEGQRTSGPGSADLSDEELATLGAPATITTGSFAVKVRRLQDRPGVRSYADSDEMMSGSDLAAQEMDFSCGPAAYGAGKLVAVRYNGRPAVLAYRPAVGDTQSVELLQCGSAEVVRSTTIPLP